MFDVEDFTGQDQRTEGLEDQIAEVAKESAAEVPQAAVAAAVIRAMIKVNKF